MKRAIPILLLAGLLAAQALRQPGTVPGQQIIVALADVSGLVTELAARAKKGAGFSASHAAVINSAGEIEAAAGSPSDCVHVDGSAQACSSGGGGGGNWAFDETPANVSTYVFTLAHTPNPAGSLALYMNGVRLKRGLDYTLATATITFSNIYTVTLGEASLVLIADYTY